MLVDPSVALNIASHKEFEYDKDSPIYKYQSCTAKKLTLRHQNKVLNLNINYNDLHFKLLLKNTALKEYFHFISLLMLNWEVQKCFISFSKGNSNIHKS